MFSKSPSSSSQNILFVIFCSFINCSAFFLGFSFFSSLGLSSLLSSPSFGFVSILSPESFSFSGFSVYLSSAFLSSSLGFSSSGMRVNPALPALA
jgi:hypothetical protein